MSDQARERYTALLVAAARPTATARTRAALARVARALGADPADWQHLTSGPAPPPEPLTTLAASDAHAIAHTWNVEVSAGVAWGPKPLYVNVRIRREIYRILKARAGLEGVSIQRFLAELVSAGHPTPAPESVESDESP